MRITPAEREAQVTCGHVASVQMLKVELHGQPLFLRHCPFRCHSETHFSLFPGESPVLRVWHRKWRGAQPPRASLWWRWGRESRPGLARRWSVRSGGYILESAVGPGLGTVRWAQLPSQGLHWAKGTSAEKGRGG